MGSSELILLDTHVWIWFNLEPERVPSEFVSMLNTPGLELGLSAVSVWETVLAAQRGRLRTDLGPEENVRAWLSASPIRVIPVDEEVAILARSLPFEHEDPADRFIAATAYKLDCPLVTVDSRLRRLPWLKVMPSQG